MRCDCGERGMSLIELLVALAVLALLLPGVLAFFVAGNRTVARAGLQTTATALAADALEEQRRRLLTQAGGTSSPVIDTPRPGVTRTVSWREREVDAGGRQVSVWELDVVVSYQDERGITRQVALETFVFPR
ncbi:MAG: prepilin-type N-terminal cleavage/methylation domain-containing protein [Firmicutes bacterium]|nr:prepilin-type N-terminal cleavage/methylation domain-containing protein [Bacillota bacterium]